MSRTIAIALLACAALDLTGCAATRGRRGEPERSGFLGDYSQLAPREGYEAQLVYVDPNADWSRYRSVYLHSVTLWADDETKNLSPKDRQMLADLLYKALRKRLGTYFAISDHPAADSVAVRAALTQAHGARVALRTVSSFVPQALVVSTVTGLSTDTAATVGSATIEMEASDAVTNERLAAAVDSRAGTKSPVTTRTFSKWADVEAACDEWAQRGAEFLVKQGVQTKPGAPKIAEGT
jgi:hypothetical protein